MNFTSLLERHAQERPDAVAFYDVDQPLTYRALLDESNRVAALLHERGARQGDRLALWLPNCTAWLATFMACARLGIIVVSMNTRFRSREVGDLVSRGRCRWLVMWPTFKDLPFLPILEEVEPQALSALEGIMVVGDAKDSALVRQHVGSLNTRASVFNYLDTTTPAEGATPFDSLADVTLGDVIPADSPAHESGSAEHRLSKLSPADGTALALVYTTSGTTSQSKLVVHDQETLIRHGHNVAQYFDIRSNDVVLLGAPLCGAFGFSSALGGLAVGAPLVSSPLLNPAECARQIQDHGVTHTFANNELLDRVLAAAGDQERPFPSLRLAGFASFAPSLEDLPERAERAGLKLVGLYGSSELQALVAGQPADADTSIRWIAGGRLTHPEGRVRVRDIETGEILPHGEVGEVEICSPSIMKGYLDNEAATAQAIDAEGYFRTGDLGHTIDDRHFIYHARRGDFLRLGGFLVNPLEIEGYIEDLDGVAHCQVVGVAHQGKTVPVAFVIPEPGQKPDEAQLLAQCKAHLAGFKVPVRIGMVESFPVVESANSNKIQRGKLQELATALLN